MQGEPLDYQKYQLFVPVLQKLGADKVVDRGEVKELVDAAVAYFPDLAPMSEGVLEAVPTEVMPDSSVVPFVYSTPVAK